MTSSKFASLRVLFRLNPSSRFVRFAPSSTTTAAAAVSYTTAAFTKGSVRNNNNGYYWSHKLRTSAALLLGSFTLATTTYLSFKGFDSVNAAPKQPIFDKKDVTVVFVLGGPGAGKGTQCERLVRDFGFVHLSAGDLLREERMRPGSQYGDIINTYIQEGKIVPSEITIGLLENAMKASGAKRFLVDGFPRKMDQALEFERSVCECKFVLFFDCPEQVMEQRLLKRGETSGRSDDNLETIRKRFKTFIDTSMPVVDHYEKEGKVRKLSCLNSVDGVYAEVKSIFSEIFGEEEKQREKLRASA